MKRFAFVVITASLLGLAHGVFAADQKIATVDLSKVFEKYYKTIQSSVSIRQEVADMEKERAQMVDAEKKHEDEWRILIDKANDQATSAEARDRSKKDASEKYSELENDKQSITTFDRVARQRLSEKEHQRRDDIVKEIMGVLNADAKGAGYTMVLDVSGASANMTPVVLYSNGQNDMTDALIKELNAAAPPGSLDTNTPATSALTTPSKSK
ncbi:MAG: OmpH family outer membrane protein [Limisphaerales bacterium]